MFYSLWNLLSSFIYLYLSTARRTLSAECERNMRERRNGIDQGAVWLMIGGKEKPSSRLVASS